MFGAFNNCLTIFVSLLLSTTRTSIAEETDNINGTYVVKQGDHYSNKSMFKTWGYNDQMTWNVTISLSRSAASYNCSSSCDDPIWYGDFNKLWGKNRCGYIHDIHEDSDRFVFKRCSDSTCNKYIEGQERIALAAYSYDKGVKPYTGENPELLKEFTLTILPETRYMLIMSMSEEGLTTFTLANADGTVLEVQTVQHSNLCDDYNKGVVDGLYFGGTCEAPEDVYCTYQS